jgi:hypothetical protein
MNEILKIYKVVIPKESVPRPAYYETYIGYFKNILEANGLVLKYDGVDVDARFVMSVDRKKIVIDYSDHPTIIRPLLVHDKYFKFHCKEYHVKKDGIVPFAPISFYDWKQYEQIKQKITYTCNNNVVLNVQRPYGNAVERRRFVRGMLYTKYRAAKNLIYSPHFSQENYWKLINNCLVHIFVPGCYNDMLDRGHLQYLAFGCCTISPPILDLLPWNKKLIPGTHYIACKPDYSDVIEKVEWCKLNRSACVQIGKNAQKLFEQSCTPVPLWKWLLVNTFEKL